MAVQVKNIFTQVPAPVGQETLVTLLRNSCVTIERIVSHTHSSPPGFWYDQAENEWVIVLRGQATLEFEGDEWVELKAGDFLTIPCHVRHRIRDTDSDTVWLAVKCVVCP